MCLEQIDAVRVLVASGYLVTTSWRVDLVESAWGHESVQAVDIRPPMRINAVNAHMLPRRFVRAVRSGSDSVPIAVAHTAF